MRKYERDRSKSRCRRYQSPQWQPSCRRRKGKRSAASIIRRFAVDVSALLFPSTGSAIPCVNTNVTGVRAVAVVTIRPNGNRRAVGGKGNAIAALITRRFAVDVSALLFPSTGSAIPCVNTNVTGAEPLPSLPSAPMATVVPSEERETLQPLKSPAASPSMSAPCCSQALVALFHA